MEIACGPARGPAIEIAPVGLRPVVRLRGRVSAWTSGKGIVPLQGRPAGGPEPRIYSAAPGYYVASRWDGRRLVGRGGAARHPTGRRLLQINRTIDQRLVGRPNPWPAFPLR